MKKETVPQTWTQTTRDPSVTEQTEEEARRDDALKTSETEFGKKGAPHVNKT